MIFPYPFFITLFNEKELYEESFFDLNLMDDEFHFDKSLKKIMNVVIINKINYIIVKMIQIQKIIYLIFVKRKK